MVAPYPDVVVNALRVFAWCALALGCSMVLWIIYAVLFA
jgi:hypothetical protein